MERERKRDRCRRTEEAVWSRAAVVSEDEASCVGRTASASDGGGVGMVEEEEEDAAAAAACRLAACRRLCGRMSSVDCGGVEAAEEEDGEASCFRTGDWNLLDTK